MPAEEITMSPAEVAAEVAAIIREDPERHCQLSWCECVAGLAIGIAAPDAVITRRWAEGHPVVMLPDGGETTVARLGAHLLGLACGERDSGYPDLFDAHRDQRYVLAELDRIAAGGS